jgi:hypothetical protein
MKIEIAEPPKKLRSLIVYIADRGIVSVRAIKNNFGRNNNYNAEQIDNMLLQLVEWELINLDNGQAIWAEL